MSRPFSSVPKGWARVGGCSRSLNTIALGSRLVKTCGASVMPTATTRTAAAPRPEGPPRRSRGRRTVGPGSALPVHVVVAEGHPIAEVHEALHVLARHELVHDAPVDDEGGVAPHELRGLARELDLAVTIRRDHRLVDELVVLWICVVGEVAPALHGVRIRVVHVE